MLFFFTVTLSVLCGTFLISETYTSDAKLMVRLGKESVSLDPTATTGQVANVEPGFENEINSELSILESRDLAEKVVDIFGPDIFLNGSPPSDTDTPRVKFRRFIKNSIKWPFVKLSQLHGKGGERLMAAGKRDAAILIVMNDLRVQTEKDSNIISITFQADNPKLARNVLTTLIDLYLDKHINAYRTRGSFEFFSKQHGILKATLTRTEQKLTNMKKQLGLMPSRDILLEQTATIEGELNKTESDLAASSANITVFTRKLGHIPQTLVASESTGMPNSARDVLVQRLNDLTLKEHELLSTFLEQSIPVIEIRKQIAEAKSLLAKTNASRQVTTSINVSYQQIQVTLIKEEALSSALEAKEAILRKQLADAAEQLKRVTDIESQMAMLQRELDIQDAGYRKYSQSMEQARIDNALQLDKISNISLIQPPTYELIPVRPRKLLNIAMGLFVSIFGGICLAYLAEFIEHTFNRPEDVEECLHVPTLATLPYAPPQKDGPSEGREEKKSPRGAYPVMGPGPPGKVQANFTSLLNILPHLRHSAGAPPEGAALLAVTSCHPGEGVTTVATYLASLLAGDLRNSRILTVDANLKHPIQRALSGGAFSFDIRAMHGETLKNVEFLALEKQVIDLARTGNIGSLARVLPAVEREYSHIIFDLPPLWADAVSIPIARAVQGVILVIEAGKTRWEVARRTKEKLTEAGIPVLGVVLNKRRHYVPQWLYGRL